MDPEENKEDNSKEFGKVIDALHNKSKLSSLRTYQGDMAEFIKSKNESVISVAVKEKERQQEKEKEVKKFELAIKPKESNKSGFQVNFTMLFLSVLLIAGGGFAGFYIFQYVTKEPSVVTVLKEEIIPYNNYATLNNITSDNFQSELSKLAFTNGISILKISDANSLPILKTKDLFDLLKISVPASLSRILKDQYVIGSLSKDQQNYYFLVITVDDFGGAFSGMLEWENSMPKDLVFLGNENRVLGVAISTSATTTQTIKNNISNTASTTVVQIPFKPEVFSWKDLIIKNKDTRAFVNEKGKSQIAYTFLDKNTVLITGDISIIGDIASTYASRSFTR
ncbi:MAG: hypothetical protein WC657_00745 [Candidatus Paceibacterota bacterium]|jgi:hypothetical protein